MTFTIPNLADAAHRPQAGLYQGDIDAIVAGINGDRVLAGCAVVQSANGPGMDVDTAAGFVLVAGVVVTVAASLDDAIGSGNATFPRIDLVEVGANGTVDVVAGTPAADPVPPSPSSGHVPLAHVFVDSSESTSVLNADITSKRVLVPRLHTLYLHVVDTDSACAVANGIKGVAVPNELEGMVLVRAVAVAHTAGTTGTMDIQVRRRRATTDADMLSTKITLDTAETDSTTAATPAVIDAANDDVAEADLLFADIDVLHTTPANGLLLALTFADE